MTTNLQGTLEKIREVIAQIGPATARQIETHPDVVEACRSSKAKARRLIERLHSQGHIVSDHGTQPKFKVAEKSNLQRVRPQIVTVSSSNSKSIKAFLSLLL